MWNEQWPRCFWETINGWWWCRESPFIQRAAPTQCVQYRPGTPPPRLPQQHPLPASVSLSASLCSPNSASRITRHGIAVMATGASSGAILCSLHTVGYNLPLWWIHSCQCAKPGGDSCCRKCVCCRLCNQICYLTEGMWGCMSQCMISSSDSISTATCANMK